MTPEPGRPHPAETVRHADLLEAAAHEELLLGRIANAERLWSEATELRERLA